MRSRAEYPIRAVRAVAACATIALVCLSFTLAFLPVQGQAQAQDLQRLALVIGNSNYASQKLENPQHDARLMAQTLESRGFDVDLRIDANSRELERAIVEFGRKLGNSTPDTVGLFYYAGHGVQAGGENYLVPVDANIQDELDLQIEAVPASTMLKGLELAGNRLNIVILDACRNNPFRASTRSGAAGLARMDAPSGTLIAYSTAPGRVAVDGNGRYSPYTRALAGAMQDQGVTVEEVFKRVRINVMDQTNGRQVPWESSSLTGDFYFTPNEAQEVATPTPEPVPTPPTTSANAGASAELLYWQTIKDSRNIAAYESYLDRYPLGSFAPLAEIRIEELRREEKQAAAAAKLAALPTPAPPAEEVNRDADPAPSQAPEPSNEQTDYQSDSETGEPAGDQTGGQATETGGEATETAALTQDDAWPEDPNEGPWIFHWTVTRGSKPNANFCHTGEETEIKVHFRNGRFLGSVRSNKSSTGTVELRLRQVERVLVIARGHGWTFPNKRYIERDATGTYRGQVVGHECNARFELRRPD